MTTFIGETMMAFIALFFSLGNAAPLSEEKYLSLNQDDTKLTSTVFDPLTEKRVWLFLDSETWKNYLVDKNVVSVIQTFPLSKNILCELHHFSDDIVYADIPLSSTAYALAISDGSTILTRTLVNHSLSQDNSWLHKITGKAQIDSQLTPIKFPAEMLTPELVNLYLEGYSPSSSSDINGYGAFPAINSLALEQIVFDKNQLASVHHWTINDLGNPQYVSAEEKIKMLNEKYNKNTSLSKISGGVTGLILFSAISTLLVASFFCFFHSEKIRKKKFYLQKNKRK